VFALLRESSGLTPSDVSANTAQSAPTEFDDLLERLVALETLLAEDMARKSKHQKPQLQQQWREEIARLEAQL
jgi:hypothetical protein